MDGDAMLRVLQVQSPLNYGLGYGWWCSPLFPDARAFLLSPELVTTTKLYNVQS